MHSFIAALQEHIDLTAESAPDMTFLTQHTIIQMLLWQLDGQPMTKQGVICLVDKLDCYVARQQQQMKGLVLQEQELAIKLPALREGADIALRASENANMHSAKLERRLRRSERKHQQLAADNAALKQAIAGLKMQLNGLQLHEQELEPAGHSFNNSSSSSSSSVQLPGTPPVPAEGAVSGLSHDVAVAVAAEQRPKAMPRVRKAVKAALRLGAAAMRRMFVCGSLAVQEHEA